MKGIIIGSMSKLGEYQRIGQRMYNFIEWLKTEKDKDVFYIEDDELIKYFEEYAL